ncbi:GTD2A protein, partial [Polyodon spathula]|nr:GTD2A protein [Polyodon spathula]
MLISADLICLKKKQAFVVNSLTRNTVAERVSDISENLNEQAVSPDHQFCSVHCILHQEALCMSEISEELQMEMIDLQCDTALKEKFSTVDVGAFYQYVGPNYPKLKSFAVRILATIGTTYVCEQLFSVMNVNKSKLHLQLTDAHLNSLRISGIF